MIICKYFKNYNLRVKVLTFISHVNPFESNVFFQIVVLSSKVIQMFLILDN